MADQLNKFPELLKNGQKISNRTVSDLLKTAEYTKKRVERKI